jgi:NMD protein affecting ribosome stability and mRNA decay
MNDGPQTDRCPICDATSEWPTGSPNDVRVVTCHDCGTYRISGSAWAEIRNKTTPDERLTYLAEARRKARPGEIALVEARG